MVMFDIFSITHSLLPSRDIAHVPPIEFSLSVCMMHSWRLMVAGMR